VLSKSKTQQPRHTLRKVQLINSVAESAKYRFKHRFFRTVSISFQSADFLGAVLLEVSPLF